MDSVSEADFHITTFTTTNSSSGIDYGGSEEVFSSDIDDWISNNDTGLNCTHHEFSSSDIEFVFHGVGISFLTLFGIPANILSVIVLKSPQMKSSLTTLLLGLTISDMFVISTSLLIFSFPAIFEYVKIFPMYVAIIHPSILPWLLPIALIGNYLIS